MKAKYISVWDGMNLESDCDYNPETKEVTDVEQIDVDGMDLDICEREFVRLEDGTEIEREDFELED